MTLGEERVRISFNPAANADVEDIKRRAADCIDWCEGRKQRDPGTVGNPEVNRLLSLAQTHFEDAAMWAVKAATFGK